MVLAKEIQKQLDALKKRAYKSQDAFNIDENKRFVFDFFTKFATVDIDE